MSARSNGKQPDGCRCWIQVCCVVGLICLTPVRAQQPELTPDQRRELDEARQLHGQVTLLFGQGKHRDAVAAAERALEIRRRILGMDHLDTAQSLNDLAGMYYEMGAYAKAEPLYQQSLEIRKTALGAEHPDTAQCLNNLAVLYYAMRAHAKAEPLFLQSLAIRKKVLGAEHPDTADSLNNLASLYCLVGDHAKAEPLFLQSLEIRKKVLGAEHLDTANSLGHLAKLYEEMGDCAKAEPLCRRSLEIVGKTLGPHPYTACCLNDLAMLYEEMGDGVKAEPLYLQSLEMTRKVLGDEHPDTAASLNNLARWYASMGDYARAEPLGRQSLEIAEKTLGAEHPNTAVCLNNLAALYESMGDYAKAEPLYQQSLEITRKSLGEEHADTAQCLNNLAVLYDAMGVEAKAELLFLQSLEIRTKVFGAEHVDTANSLNNLAALYRELGEDAKAESLYQQSLDIVKKALGAEHPNTAILLSNLAALYESMGDGAKAELLYQQSLEITRKVLGTEHLDMAGRLNNLAALYESMGDRAKAEPLYRQALAISRKHLELAAAVQSERQQVAMTRRLRYTLDSYLSFAAQSGKHDETAYRQLLAWKGMVLTRQQALRSEAERPDLKPLYDELHAVTRDLARLAFATPGPKEHLAWQQNVARLSARRETLESELAGKNGAYRAAKQQATLEDLRAVLPDDVVLVDFLEYRHHTADRSRPGGRVWQRRLLAFVVGKQGLVRLVDLGETASLGKVIDTWRRGFGCTSESAEAGQQLRTAIWEPIEDQLGEGRAGKPNLVLVSPDGALGRLPLAALPGRKPDSYVLEDWPLAVIPAPQALPRLLGSQGVRKPEGNLLVLGDVDYDARSIVPAAQPKKPFPAAHRYPPRGEADALFRRLDGTRGELAAIEKMYRNNFGDAGLKTLEGPHATKDALAREASRHFCLHLATHGFFADPKFRSALERSGRDLGGTELVSRQSLSGYHPGLLSGLALAGANKPDAEDDGILTAEEVATLDLTGMDLAVLSACETGLGEVAGGEGLLGLQRAFQTAGARTVVASLWKVDDVATRDLMERFYDHLWNKNQGKLAALREAQLWMLRDRGRRGLTPLEDEEKRLKSNRLPPYYWAAFVLSGDWR